MPYKSQAQRGKFHALLEQGKISPATVAEFDKASEGMKLPKRVTPKPKPRESDGTFVNHGRTTRTGSQRRARRGY